MWQIKAKIGILLPLIQALAMNKKGVILVGTLFLLLTSVGCFRKWRMTDRELERYFAPSAHKPTYYTIENDSLRLFVAASGPDTLPPLLLIHGAPGGWYGYVEMFDDTLLRKQYQLIAIDRLGYNHSYHKRKRFVTSIETHARAAALALQFNKSKRKGAVLGRSYGAPIAAKIAMIQPQKFERVVLLASAIDPKLEKFWWFSSPAKWWVLRVWLPHRLNVATFEKFAHVAELQKLAPHWTNLYLPTTFVQGGKDWIVAPENLDYARRQMQHNPQARFILLPDAGHLISKSHPGLVRQLLLDHPAGQLGGSTKP
jgi:pimeloyl-ACP methyl ester carboxylesterase